MTNAELAQRIDKAIATLSAFPEIDRQAKDEAERLIYWLSLQHPVTFAAALRIVSENTTIAELKLVTATANWLVSSLKDGRRSRPLNAA